MFRNIVSSGGRFTHGMGPSTGCAPSVAPSRYLRTGWTCRRRPAISRPHASASRSTRDILVRNRSAIRKRLHQPAVRHQDSRRPIAQSLPERAHAPAHREGHRSSGRMLQSCESQAVRNVSARLHRVNSEANSGEAPLCPAERPESEVRGQFTQSDQEGVALSSRWAGPLSSTVH